MCIFGLHLTIGKWFNQTHCVRYFTKMHPSCFMIWPVNKADNMCYLIYWFHLGYIGSLKSELIRHRLLAISKRFFSFFAWIDQWINQKIYVLANLMSSFGVHWVIEMWIKQTHCIRYFTKIHFFSALIDKQINHTLYVSDNLLCCFGLHLFIEKWFKNK